MERIIRWGRPTQERGRLVYVSKCGRYRIEKRMMANIGGRAGHFGQVSYLATSADGERADGDSLRDAKDWAETFHNPDWEP